MAGDETTSLQECLGLRLAQIRLLAVTPWQQDVFVNLCTHIGVGKIKITIIVHVHVCGHPGHIVGALVSFVPRCYGEESSP